MKRRLIGMLLCITMVCGLAGCGKKGDTEGDQSTENAQAKKKDTIVCGIADNVPGIFNPLVATKTTDQDINKIIYPSMLEITDTGDYQPYLAESYEVSEDNLKMTFHLQEKAKWYDGEPVTAEDVAFTFESIFDKDFTGTSYEKVSSITGAKDKHEGTVDKADGVKVIDEHTIEFTFDNVYAPAFADIATRGIIPEHIWGDIPIAEFENQVDLFKNPIGCGPYKVEEYVEGQYINMTANEDFFLGKPKTEKFVIKIVTPDSILAEYQNGTIDIVSVRDLTSDDLTTLTDTLGIEVVNFPNNVYRYIGINMRKEVFQDKNLREALIYAIDRKQIIESILEGKGIIVDAPFLPAGWAKADESKLTVRSYDPEKAKELLKESGYEDRDGDGIAENEDGVKLSFTYKIPSDSQITEQVALVVQQSFKDIGVNVELKTFEYQALATEAIFNHDFDFYTLNCQFGLDPDIKSWWHSSSVQDEVGVPSWNFDGFKNEEVDKLIDQANATLDQDERKAAYNDAAAIISEEAPMIFLYVQDNAYAYPAGTEGFSPYTFNVFYNIYNWTVPQK